MADIHTLELTDLEPLRQRVVFGDNSYELKGLKEFGPREHSWFSSRTNRINELLTIRDTLTDAQERELEDLFCQFVDRVVIEAPEGFARRLSYMQRVQIFTFWSEGFTRAMGAIPSQQSGSDGNE